MTELQERVLQNIIALFLICLGLGTWFLGGRSEAAERICVALIGSGTTYLMASSRGKKADAVVETAKEVNIDEK